MIEILHTIYEIEIFLQLLLPLSLSLSSTAISPALSTTRCRPCPPYPLRPPTPPSLPPDHRLLIGPPYESIDELMTDLNTWARDKGLGFIKNAPSNKADGHYTRYEILCDRGKASSTTSMAKVRSTATAKTDCQFHGVAKALVVHARKWTFEIKKDSHNHKASATPVTHLVHRGLTEEMKAIVASMSLVVAIRLREIYTALQQRYPLLKDTFTVRDIENYRAQLQQQKMEGYTPVQALLKDLEASGLFYRVCPR